MKEQLFAFLGIQDLFGSEEILPIYMLISASGYSKLKDDAES